MMSFQPRRWADRLLRRGPSAGPASGRSADDERMVAGVRAGDESVFTELIDRYGAAMMKIALIHVQTPAVAEEVVQETWVAVLRGIDGFEGRSSLRTWIMRILVNRARSAAACEHRSLSWSALTTGDEWPSVPAARFTGERTWAEPPRSWAIGPEEQALVAETLRSMREALDALPPAQRTVVVLRDVHGLPSHEVCELLDLTPANQRVLLHRGRSRIRAHLEERSGDRSGARE